MERSRKKCKTGEVTDTFVAGLFQLVVFVFVSVVFVFFPWLS